MLRPVELDPLIIKKSLLFKSLSITSIISISLFNILAFLFNFKPLKVSLIYFPIYLFCLVLILKKIKYLKIISIVVILALLLPGIKNNQKILESKKSNFEYDLILNTQIKNIYTFSDTLSPFIYFDQTNKIFNEHQSKLELDNINLL